LHVIKKLKLPLNRCLDSLLLTFICLKKIKEFNFKFLIQERPPSSKSSKSGRDKNETPLDGEPTFIADEAQVVTDQDDLLIKPENDEATTLLDGELTIEVTGPPHLDEDQQVNQGEQTLNESSLAEDTNTLPNDESGAIGDGGGDLNASINDASADEASKGDEGSGAHSGVGVTSAGKKDETNGAASGGGASGGGSGADAEKHKKELLAKRKTRQPKFDGNLIPEEGDESDVGLFKKNVFMNP
jgi:hypothetical protein